MTEEDEGICEYENGFDFYKDNADHKIWSVETPETRDSIGEMLFSFDKKNRKVDSRTNKDFQE